MTCHIIDRKANDLSRTSGFAITVAVAVCDFLRVCALSAPFVVCASSAPSASASASTSASASASASVSVSASTVPGSSAPSASSMACLLSVLRPLCLRLLCLC